MAVIHIRRTDKREEDAYFRKHGKFRAVRSFLDKLREVERGSALRFGTVFIMVTRRACPSAGSLRVDTGPLPACAMLGAQADNATVLDEAVREAKVYSFGPFDI